MLFRGKFKPNQINKGVFSACTYLALLLLISMFIKWKLKRYETINTKPLNQNDKKWILGDLNML